LTRPDNKLKRGSAASVANPRVALHHGKRQNLNTVKAKFHYAIWFEAGRRPASNQIA